MLDITPQTNHTKLTGVKQVRRKRSSKTPEGKVKDQVAEMLDATPNCWWFMPVQNGMGQSGIPDFICCVNGRFLGIETKSKKSSHKLTALQAKQIQLIEKANGRAVVINEDNLHTLPELLENL